MKKIWEYLKRNFGRSAIKDCEKIGKKHEWYLSVEPSPGVTALTWFNCKNCNAYKWEIW